MVLYLCRFEIDVMVEADSREEAETIAEDCVEEESRNLWGVNGGSREIRTVEECPPEWLDSIPYGGDRTDSVRQILASEPEEPAPPRDDRTIDMFATPVAPCDACGHSHSADSDGGPGPCRNPECDCMTWVGAGTTP